jgi:hypothetical protein
MPTLLFPSSVQLLFYGLHIPPLFLDHPRNSPEPTICEEVRLENLPKALLLSSTGLSFKRLQISQSFERCVKYRLLYVTLSCSAEFGVSVRFLVFRVEDLIVVELNFVSGLLGVFGKVRNVVRCAVYMLWFWVECGGEA